MNSPVVSAHNVDEIVLEHRIYPNFKVVEIYINRMGANKEPEQVLLVSLYVDAHHDPLKPVIRQAPMVDMRGPQEPQNDN